jgi:hypothetical protein
MHIPKRYGQSMINRCPFCQSQATSINTQGVPVCGKHKNENLGEMICACGSYMEMKNGKYGIFFVCQKCGTRSLKQALEINESRRDESKPDAEKPATQNEITVRSDDPRYF